MQLFQKEAKERQRLSDGRGAKKNKARLATRLVKPSASQAGEVGLAVSLNKRLQTHPRFHFPPIRKTGKLDKSNKETYLA